MIARSRAPSEISLASAWLGRPLPSQRSYIPSIAAMVAGASLALLMRRDGVAYDFSAAAGRFVLRHVERGQVKRRHLAQIVQVGRDDDGVELGRARARCVRPSCA